MLNEIDSSNDASISSLSYSVRVSIQLNSYIRANCEKRILYPYFLTRNEGNIKKIVIKANNLAEK